MKTIEILQKHLTDLKSRKNYLEHENEHHELMLRRGKKDAEKVDADIKELEIDLEFLQANK